MTSAHVYPPLFLKFEAFKNDPQSMIPFPTLLFEAKLNNFSGSESAENYRHLWRLKCNDQKRNQTKGNCEYTSDENATTKNVSLYRRTKT